jgi:hypothetical protein
MKLNCKNLSNYLLVNSLFLAVFTLLFFSAPKRIAAQANLQKAIKNHIEKVQEDADEYKKARKIVYGDVDGDGVKDAVVQYTLEGFGGGNSWGQSIAVFLNKKGVYKMSADETVGGKFFRSFNLQKVVGKQIIGATETCPEDGPQGLCKNPKREQVKFILSSGKLIEK